MIDVLVIGAGPTGLTLASELLRRGVSVRVIDKTPAPSPLSRALAVHARTLELLDLVCLADKLIASAQKVHGVNAYSGASRLLHLSLEELESPYPFAIMVPQAETERVLTEHVRSLGGEVERNLACTGLVQHADRVEVELSNGERVEAAWAAGADGAHSAVRKLIGVGFEGAPYEEGFVLADLDVDWDRERDETHVFFSPEGALVFLPLPGQKRWRLIADCDERAPDLACFERLVAERVSIPARVGSPGWMTSFRIHRRLASKYRNGRVFIAGDAAHIHSPLGGQGMNTGMQDAMNLGWKLALVARGLGRPEILDSYEVERRPIAASTVRGTDLATRAVTLRSPAAREVLAQLGAFLSAIEVVQDRLTRAAAGIANDYRKSPIVAEDRDSLFEAHLLRSATSERPSMLDWLELDQGPRPGDRAPDVEHLHRWFRGTGHTLLLFDGRAATREGYRRLAAIAERVKLSGLPIEPVVVIPSSARPPELAFSGPILFDESGAVHRRYGAAAECLYLVRPDAYVAYRSQPADEAKLFAYLARIFGH